ncbi:low affinity immunoglobulin gamma Fc region receptor II-a-like [Embiotoca jacksoni]|uniref:low affinity immunoglobulin gamma Fc region receptor II-a-like n=1 Tax=Embiotoca jacksoni TaxID=100190 RepID=UPI003703CB25
MEVTALGFRLGFLRVSPNRLQHFQHESVSFSCVGFGDSARVKWMKNTGEPSQTVPIKTSGAIDRAYVQDSGTYWCETDTGETSNAVNITVTDGPVILDSPALPLMEGTNVTLRCTNKENSGELHSDFYKDGSVLVGGSAGTKIIHRVSKSDEGLYKCNTSRGRTSAESRLVVRVVFVTVIANTAPLGSPTPPQEVLSESPRAPHALVLLCVAVTVSMTVLVLLMVGVLHVRKHRVSSKTPTAASHSDEDRPTVSGDDDAGVTYAAVVTKPRKDKESGSSVSMATPNPSAAAEPSLEEEETIYSPVQMATKSS